MAKNPNGFVPVFDFGSPKIITASAREAISGGQFVFSSGAANTVSSGLNSFASSDIKVAVATNTPEKWLGVALANAESGALVSVAVEGAILARCDGSVFASEPVEQHGGDSVRVLGSAAVPVGATNAGMAANKCGRALTEGSSGNYALVYLTL